MLRVVIDFADFDTTMRMFILNENNGKLYLAKPTVLEFVEVDEGALSPEATLKFQRDIGREMIQALIEEFEKKGYVDSTKGLSGKLEAQTKHLEDMRSLVFKKEPKEETWIKP